jgi:hypothetical protein
MADRKKTTFLRLTNGRLNRKQRRDLERQLSVEEPGLEIVNRNVAGMTLAMKATTWLCPQVAIRSQCRSSEAGRQIWSGWPTG